ncbi:MAG TPA: DUF885 domain-containing protein [Candidatus Limnocylindria bacterium]|nr:DUF885 domain-containing protein [Candidatus Limnocylindria bacterium]
MSELQILIDDFLRNEYETSPVLASGLGLTDYDERLDDLSAAAFNKRDADAEAYLARFEAVTDDGLDADQRIDRDLAVAMLRGRAIAADWQGWKRDPLVYSGPVLNGLFTLFLHRLRANADLVDAAVARLEQVPRALEQGRANLDAGLAHPLIVERGLNSARAGGRYVRDLLLSEAETDSGRGRLRAAGAIAGNAFDEWVGFLEGLLPQAHGEWQWGEERYSRTLRERESLDHDARSLREMGRQEYDRLDAEMQALCRETRGTTDWRQVLEEANENHPRTEEEMRRAYEEWTERSRTFLAETGLVTMPVGESCAVVPSPVFQRPVLGVAFYIAPPAFSDRLTGNFFVPFAPDGTPEEELQQRLASNNYGSIPTTSVHEAYPGHHWHLTWSKVNAAPIRLVLGTPYFSEGWALYSERVMRERGFFTDPLQELYHLEATIFRAARIVVDTSLHLGEMTFEEAVTFMTTKVPLPEPTARAEVGRYCWWPTQASAYLTGCLEILRIRQRFLEARGLGDVDPADVDVAVLREFHDRLAGSGRLPLGLAERAVMEPAADM